MRYVLAAIVTALGLIGKPASAQMAEAPVLVTVGGGYHMQTCSYPGCRASSVPGDYTVLSPLVGATISRYLTPRFGIGGELIVYGTVRGLEYGYKDPLRDAAHQNTFAAVLFHVQNRSQSRWISEAVVGPALVFSHVERTLICRAGHNSAECAAIGQRPVPNERMAGLLGVIGGFNAFRRLGNLAIGPMVRVAYLHNADYAVGCCKLDRTGGPIVISAAVGARFGFVP